MDPATQDNHRIQGGEIVFPTVEAGLLDSEQFLGPFKF